MKNRLALLAALFCAGTLHGQSLLTQKPETLAQQTARELLLAPAQTRDALLNQLDDASQRLWNSPDPQAVLEALGTKAASLFAVNQAFGELVAGFLQTQEDTEGLARLVAIQARTKLHTVHGDGTVTIDPEPEE